MNEESGCEEVEQPRKLSRKEKADRWWNKEMSVPLREIDQLDEIDFV